MPAASPCHPSPPRTSCGQLAAAAPQEGKAGDRWPRAPLQRRAPPPVLLAERMRVLHRGHRRVEGLAGDGVGSGRHARVPHHEGAVAGACTAQRKMPERRQAGVK
jgi:hypothetical protein